MLSHLIKKEILDNFLSQRFLWACVVSIVLMVSSLVVLSEYYEEEARDYANRANVQNDFIDTYGHVNRINWMSSPLRGPSRYLPLVTGIDREALQENFISNPVPVLFSRLDFVAIVTIIMSLVAVLVSYDAISGEREAGLLKLTLSTAIPRSSIILGKFIGGIISLLVPFTLGILAGLLYFAVAVNVQLVGADFVVFVLLLLTSYTYIAVFYALGLLFSCLSNTSGQALLKSLFGWVVLVLVIPNISPFLAAQFYRIPSWTKVQQDVSRITSTERDAIIRSRSRELFATKFSDLNALVTMTKQDIEARIKSDPVFRNRMAEWGKANEEMMKEVNRIQQAQAKVILQDFSERSKGQEHLAKVFASASPFCNFIFIATDLTESGIHADDQWEEQSSAYERVLGQFVDTRYQSAKQADPAFDVNQRLDLRGHPEFRYEPQPLSARIEYVVYPFGILAAFGLLFFTGAIVSFMRYDVR